MTRLSGQETEVFPVQVFLPTCNLFTAKNARSLVMKATTSSVSPLKFVRSARAGPEAGLWIVKVRNWSDAFKSPFISTTYTCYFYLVKTCGEPPAIEHGSIESCSSDFNFESVCFYACDAGFSMDAGTDRKITCGADEQWDGTIPECRGLFHHSISHLNKCDVTS